MALAQDQFIDKIKAGDKDAFWHLVSLYKNKAFGLCYSIVGNTEDAKDVLQEAFIKVYRSIESFRKGSSFYTWFYVIVVNTARDYLRREARRKTVPLENAIDFHFNSEKTILTRELRQVLNSAIRQLSEKQQLTFVMKHVDGMKIDEIAMILNCRPSTIKVHLFRAVKTLQKKLAPYLTTGRQGGKDVLF